MTWGVRGLKRTTNKENGDTERANQSRGTESNDEDSPVQAPRDEQVHEDDAIHRNQAFSETTV